MHHVEHAVAHDDALTARLRTNDGAQLLGGPDLVAITVEKAPT
jgi:hypothetical protein